jgi:hypothetical protein
LRPEEQVQQRDARGSAHVVYAERGGLLVSLLGQLIEARRVLAPRAAGLTTLRRNSSASSNGPYAASGGDEAAAAEPRSALQARVTAGRTG